MRHNKKFNHLGRKKAHRESMLANMAVSLIMHKRIQTTVAKAKALRTYVEPLITKSKDDTTHSRRVVFSYIQDKFAVTELFRDVAAKVGDRPGGYTRILKTGTRFGDAADMCYIELVDFNEVLLKDSQEKSEKKSTRRKRSTKKSTETTPVQAPIAQQQIEEVSNVEEVQDVVVNDQEVEQSTATDENTKSE